MTKEAMEIKILVNELNNYRNEYYNNNKSLISDQEYDKLFDELSTLEEKTGIIYATSPTQTVGYSVVSQLKKVKHNHALLSLEKTTDIEELKKHFLGSKTLVMAKADGLTCSLVYKNGKLISAESRGNGEIGEDIINNVLTIKNLPITIPFDGEVIIDGECIIKIDDFDKLNAPLIKAAEKEADELGLTDKDKKEYVKKHSYANPRNLVSGSVRQLDSKIAASRQIQFVAWKLYKATDIYGNEIYGESFYKNFEFMESLGFETVPRFPAKTADVIGSLIEGVRLNSEARNIPIDGAVVALDNIKYGLSLGETGHHPKHSYAYKFYQDDNETVLTDIEWGTSRTGLVTPVAIFEPTEIDGTIVSRASLCNVSIIKELEIGIGDTVTVIKSNQIIPKITQNITRSNTYKIPDVCPVCGNKLILKNDNGREMLYCQNKQCFAVIKDKIANFASREAMNIVGISSERLDMLMKLGFITDFESIYNLYKRRDELAECKGFGESSVNQIISAIEDSKKCDIVNVIIAIGIPGIGKSAAKTISEHCILKDKDKPFNWFIDNALRDYYWGDLTGIGELTSRVINDYIVNNIDEIRPLLSILTISTSDSVDNSKGVLTGKTFCITGKLSVYANRKSLETEVANHGGVVVSGVTAKTDFLITNDKDSGSSKNKAAEKFGTKIIDEKEFLEIIK